MINQGNKTMDTANLFDVFDEDATFLMRTTKSVLRRVLNLADTAMKRIELETANNGICTLHFNGRPNPVGKGKLCLVQFAVGPRSN
jgi:hypothetical protein